MTRVEVARVRFPLGITSLYGLFRNLERGWPDLRRYTERIDGVTWWIITAGTSEEIAAHLQINELARQAPKATWNAVSLE